MTNSTLGSRTSAGSGKMPTGKQAAITFGALLLGGGALALMSHPSKRTQNPDGTTTGAETDETMPAPALDVMPVADPNETFDQAFAQAREELGAGGLFVWHGNVYHTFTRGEWVDLSLDQRQEFISSVGKTEQSNSLEVQPLVRAVAANESAVEPIYTEGTVDGYRVIGVDLDRDGMVDDLIMQDTNGLTFRVIDRQGDEGLDTVLAFDPITGESTMLLELDEPIQISTENLDMALLSPEVSQSVQFAMEAEMILEDEPTTETSGAVLPSPEDDNAGDEVMEELTVPTEDLLNLDVPTEAVTGEEDNDEELEDLTVYDEVGTYAQNDDTDSSFGHHSTH